MTVFRLPRHLFFGAERRRTTAARRVPAAGAAGGKARRRRSPAHDDIVCENLGVDVVKSQFFIKEEGVMSESSMKKMKREIAKVASKSDRKMLRRAVRRGARPIKNFNAAVAKAVNNLKTKEALGYKDQFLGTDKFFIANPAVAGESIVLLSNIGVGAGISQHSNKKYLNHGGYLRGQIVGLANATSNDCSLVWVLDMDPQAAMPKVGDIFSSVTTTEPCVYAMLNPTGSARFRILARRNYSIHGAPDTAGETRSHQYVEEYINYKNIETTCKGDDDGSIGTIQKNAIYLVLLGSSASGGGLTAAQFKFGEYRHQFLDV